jgi:hypothetical protein
MRVAPDFGVVALGVIAAVALSACSEDLGTCDAEAMASAMAIVYSDNGTPYYAGQGLVQSGCSNGVCHSSTATQDGRRGAPHGLDFDLQPLFAGATPDNISALQHGVAKVREEASDIYGQIVSGAMPPGEAGQRPTPTWRYSDGTVATDLPGISTDVGKATVRAWLACGAPVVSGIPGAPPDANAISGSKLVPPLATGPTGASFTAVYDGVLKSCGQSCHAPMGLDPLDLSSQSIAYSSLVGKDGAGMCAGKGKLVDPGNCKTSLLYLKLQPNPVCGLQMPLGMAPVNQAGIDALCKWITDGAKP